jgi:two-component system, NarL family, sensor histidine kinase UhpB
LTAPDVETDASQQARLAEQLITAEQDERRRLALFLHDGPVQSLSGIALMLDAVRHAIDEGRLDDAHQILETALERHRDTIRSLRDLSFNLEPVVLRDQGFAAAVQGLAERLGISEEIQIDLDVEPGESLTDNAQVALYQIVREALNQAVRRGPTRISVSIGATEGGGIATVIVDDGHGERRRASVEEIESRARPMNGSVTVEGSGDGTVVRIELPAYTARR